MTCPCGHPGHGGEDTSTARVLEVVKSKMWEYEAEDRCAKQLKIHIHDAIGLVGRAQQDGTLFGYRGMVEPR